MLDLVGKTINGILVLRQLPRKLDANGELLRDKKNKPYPIMYECRCQNCGTILELETYRLRQVKGLCECQKKEIKSRMLKNLASCRKLVIELRDDIKCAYPNNECERSRNGVCCWDCDDYTKCMDSGVACLNNPAKCGSKNRKDVSKNKPTAVYDKSNNLLGTYESLSKACKAHKVDYSYALRSLRAGKNCVKGLIFCYV